MTDKQLWERLHKNAEWARGNEWETPLCLADDLTAAADALNGVAYRDDSAIVELRVAKRYGNPERLVVRVSGDLEPEEEVVEGLHHG